MDRLLAETQQAEGTAGQDGDPWKQPQGPWDAYPKGAVRTHKNKTWQSTVTMNVWEPTVSGWREVIPPNPDTGETEVPEYVQPTGAHDAYQTGEQVLWEDGEIYESVIDGNVWSPTARPAAWKLIED